MDKTNASSPDRRPAIVICACDPDDGRWDPIIDLSGTPWSPDGARTVALAADTPERLADQLRNRLDAPDCRAVLLVGASRHGDRFEVQMRAENRRAGGERLSMTGPGVVRSNAPVAEIVRALGEAGLPATATSCADEDVGSYLLYSALSEVALDVEPPAVALLRLPAQAPAAEVDRGVKAAARAMTRRLPPLPLDRLRLS